MEPRRITVFDTTLRDGEQSIGLAFTPDEKVAIARRLERLGVDVIEAGFPVASEGELAGVRAVAAAVRGPVVAAMARPAQVDLDAAALALEGARRSRVHIVLASSDLHLERKLQLTREEVVELARWAVDYSRTRFDEVQFCCEDASRSDPAFLAELCGAAIDAGATVINLPDTVGFAVPEQYAALLREVRALCPALETVTVAVHCHDDLGLATANTLAGVAAGAGQIECTMNGLGERAGNAALEEVVSALVAHRDELGVETGIDPAELAETSRLVADAERLSALAAQAGRRRERASGRDAEVEPPDVGIRQQLGGGPAQPDDAAVEDGAVLRRPRAPSGRSARRAGSSSRRRRATPSVSKTSLRAFGASPIDGSSISITFGSSISARAISTVFCSPPESEPARSRRRSRDQREALRELLGAAVHGLAGRAWM